ncbi:hypothetical protein JCM17961_02140 [Endothiovibrio diazotrophicus]
MERKLAALSRFLTDLRPYAAMESDARRREHYAIERLLQLLCEAAADIALQVCKAEQVVPASSYREIFSNLASRGVLPEAMADELVEACAMRDVLTHLYDTIDLDLVIGAVEPAVELYGTFLAWAVARADR